MSKPTLLYTVDDTMSKWCRKGVVMITYLNDIVSTSKQYRLKFQGFCKDDDNKWLTIMKY